MEYFLYALVGVVARIHNYILALNNSSENVLTDKQLHFLIIGIVGIALVLILYPLFKLLARTGHTMVITFFYVLTVMIVIAFAIEIGQRVTGTGAMEFADIVYGIAGFLLFFIIFIIIRAIYHGILKVIKKAKASRTSGRYNHR